MDNNNWNDPNNQNPYDNQYNANDQYQANNQYNSDGQYNGNQYGQYGQYNQYGNSGQYGNMGGTPLNKNGQPVPNRFGMKLTFSILEIISCNLISFICGIIGCIFTCKANTAYKEGRWNDFLSHAKASAISLWIGLVGIVLRIIFIIVICVLSFSTFKTIMEDPSKIEYYLEKYTDGEYNQEDIDKWLDEYGNIDDNGYDEVYTEMGNYYEFDLQGNHIVLPISAAEFMQMGYTISLEDNTDDVIGADGYVSLQYMDSEGNYIGSVDILNPTDQDIQIEQGVIAGISISNQKALGGDFCPAFTFGNGYTFDTAEDTVVGDLGECAYEYHSEDADIDASYYEWRPQSYEGAYYNRLQVDYWDGVMETVYINYAGE